MVRLLLCITLLASAVLIGFGSVAGAQDGACLRLWVERNAVYKANGYCFKTRRAISYFGNAGCVYDYEGDVPLSGAERALVGRLRAEERALGCR